MKPNREFGLTTKVLLKWFYSGEKAHKIVFDVTEGLITTFSSNRLVYASVHKLTSVQSSLGVRPIARAANTVNAPKENGKDNGNINFNEKRTNWPEQGLFFNKF